MDANENSVICYPTALTSYLGSLPTLLSVINFKAPSARFPAFSCAPFHVVPIEPNRRLRGKNEPYYVSLAKRGRVFLSDTIATFSRYKIFSINYFFPEKKKNINILYFVTSSSQNFVYTFRGEIREH